MLLFANVDASPLNLDTHVHKELTPVPAIASGQTVWVRTGGGRLCWVVDKVRNVCTQPLLVGKTG